MLIGFFYLEFGLDFGRISVVSFQFCVVHYVNTYHFIVFPLAFIFCWTLQFALLVDQARVQVQVRTNLQDVNAGKQGRI